jgi:3-oxoacyl-[acyl-carrier protein] reductase
MEEKMNKIDLNHRHAVITGGAQGIGFSVATRLLKSGASVSLWDRDADILDPVLKDLRDKGTVSGETVDVANFDSVSPQRNALCTSTARLICNLVVLNGLFSFCRL